MSRSIDLRRRGLLRASGVTLLSASAVALLAGEERSRSPIPVPPTTSASRTQRSLEHEAISAYQLGAQSGLLRSRCSRSPCCSSRITREHRDALVATICKLGGTPVVAKSDAEVAKA